MHCDMLKIQDGVAIVEKLNSRQIGCKSRIKAPLAEIFIRLGKCQISTTVSETIWAFRFTIESKFI